MRTRTIMILAGLTFAAMARGEAASTTQPATAATQSSAAVSPSLSAVPRVLTATVDWMTSSVPAATPSFTFDATARSFDGGAPIAVTDLAGRFDGSRVLATLAYSHTPTTLASDLSKRLTTITDVPGGSLAPLLIAGDATHANKVAATWIHDRLAPTGNDSIGVCVLLGKASDVPVQATTPPTDPADATATPVTPPEPKLTLVLVKIATSTTGEQQIARIELGQPAALAK